MKIKINCARARELKYISMDLLAHMDKVKSIENTLYNDIIIAAEKIIERETKIILKTISIDELGRNKEGIRVNLLRTRKYNSMADIENVTVRSLTYIKGIGAETAKEIRKEIDNIIETTRKNVRIKLNSDNKTSFSTALIVAIYAYLQEEEYRKKVIKIFDSVREKMIWAISNIEPATKELVWRFTFGKKKTTQ